MIAGHFGFAAAVKAKEPRVPLWALMLACQWLDVAFVPLLLTGIERFEPIAGTKPGAYGGAVIFADYTHSLLGAAVLSVVFGAVAALRYGRRSGIVLGLVAASHWVLDLPMHRADMPLLPGNMGNFPRMGFGLWRWPLASASLELAIVLVGGILYARAALRVAGEDKAAARRARLCGALLPATGLVVLALNLLGF